MAPEMLKGQCYDERVDIFSFGIMLCEVRSIRVEEKPLELVSTFSDRFRLLVVCKLIRIICLERKTSG